MHIRGSAQRAISKRLIAKVTHNRKIRLVDPVTLRPYSTAQHSTDTLQLSSQNARSASSSRQRMQVQLSFANQASKPGSEYLLVLTANARSSSIYPILEERKQARKLTTLGSPTPRSRQLSFHFICERQHTRLQRQRHSWCRVSASERSRQGEALPRHASAFAGVYPDNLPATPTPTAPSING